MKNGDEVRRYLHALLLMVLHPFVALVGAIAGYEVVRTALRFVDFSWQTKTAVSGFAGLITGSMLFTNPQSYRRAFEVSLYPFLFPICGVALLAALPFPEPLDRYKGGLLGISIPLLAIAGLQFHHYRARYRPPRTPERTVVQGARLIPFEEAQARNATLRRVEKPGTIRWGGLDLPDKFATEHFSIVGSSGSGKSIHLSYLLKSVLTKMRAGEDCRIVVYDSKRNLYGQIREMAPDIEIRILNPFDARTYVWDVAADFQNETDIVEAAQTFFPKPAKPGDEFFYLAPQGMLAGAITGLHAAAPKNWTLRDALAAFESQETLRRVMGFAESKNRDRINLYLGDQRPNRDVLITVANQIQQYRAAAAAWAKLFANEPARRLSLSDWIKGNYVLLVPGNPRNPSSLHAINRIIFRRLFQLVLSQEPREDPRYWFFFDEFGTMEKLEGIQHFLFESRVRGAAVALGFQDVASLEESYERTGLDQIMQGTANIGALGIRGNSAAKWAENYFGMQYIVEETHHEGVSTGKDGPQHSQGTGQALRSKPLLYGADFQQLANEGADTFPGYFNTARVGIYRYDLPKAEAARDVPRTDNNSAENFVECDPELPVFEFWSKEEREKLKLPIEEPSPVLKPQPTATNLPTVTPPTPSTEPPRPPHVRPGGLRRGSTKP